MTRHRMSSLWAVLAAFAFFLPARAESAAREERSLTSEEISHLAAQSLVKVINVRRDQIVFGTGFSVGDGLFLTAAFVVNDADAISIETPDLLIHPAALLRASQIGGFALIRAPDASVPALSLSDRNARPGERVYLVGIGSRGESSAGKEPGTVVASEPSTFSYSRDGSPAPGLAGSPVILSTGAVAGLHLGAGTSDTGSMGRGVPIELMRRGLPEIAQPMRPAEERGSTVIRKWQSFIDLGCSEIMKRDVVAVIPLRPGEEVRDVTVVLEDLEFLTPVSPPTVARRTADFAIIHLEVRADRTFLFFGCHGGARAMVVVAFHIGPRTESQMSR